MALPAAARYEELSIEGQPVAAALDWEDETGKVAGFLLSIPGAAPQDTTAPASTASVEVLRRLWSSGAYKEVHLRSAGRPTTSAGGGHPVVAGVEVEIEPFSDVQLHKIRNRLYPVVLGLDISQVGGLPSTPETKSSNAFKLVYATMARPDGRLIVTGAVAVLDDFASLVSKSQIRAAGLADATLVGDLDGTTRSRCEPLAFSGSPLRGAGKVDLLWVVDGSDSSSMIQFRIQLHQAAGELWTRLASLGLDLRQAVVGMDQRYAGRLCSTNTISDPGRFWGPSPADLAGFQACLLQPSQTLDPDEDEGFGLASAERTLVNLLPRKQDDPRYLRQGALTAVIFVSDRPDRDVDLAFTGSIPDPPLSKEAQQKLDHVITPLITLLRKTPDSGSGLAGTVVLALAPDPQLKCGTRRGTGYIELAQALEGFHEPVCQSDESMADRMRQVVDHLAARLTRLQLRSAPVSASLQGALNGEALFRSHRRGLDPVPSEPALLLYGMGEAIKDAANVLDVGYVSW